MYERYAIFYTPRKGIFADFGAAWLGWDSAAGKPAAHLEGTGIDLVTLTATPRKYGFHATIKAPFRPVPAITEAEIRAALDGFAARRSPVSLGDLQLSLQNGFLALRPSMPNSALQELCAAVVRDLDPLRAPLTPDDIARRRRSRLSPRQDQQMLDWGYPFIFDDFNFHMTLSGRLKTPQAQIVFAQAEEIVARYVPQDLMLDALSLMGEDTEGRFHQLHRVSLI